MSGSGGPLRETHFASEQDTQKPHGEWQLNVVYAVEQVVVYSTLPQEYSTLTFGERLLLMVVERKREAK